MASNLFFIVVIIIGVFFAGASCLLGVYVKKKRIIKYIPAGIGGIASLTFLVKAFYFSKGYEGIGYIIFTMISAAVFVISLIPALVIEFVNRRK